MDRAQSSASAVVVEVAEVENVGAARVKRAAQAGAPSVPIAQGGGGTSTHLLSSRHIQQLAQEALCKRAFDVSKRCNHSMLMDSG